MLIPTISFMPSNLKLDAKTELAKKLPIDTDKLVRLVKSLRAAGVGYKIAKNAQEIARGVGKAQFSTSVEDIDDLDCSGFVRYSLYKASSGKVIAPDGSWRQGDWFAHQGLTAVNYQKSGGLQDGHLRVALFHGSPGHIWMVLNGMTIESHGGVGPDRRPWNTSVLFAHAMYCYVLT